MNNKFAFLLTLPILMLSSCANAKDNYVFDASVVTTEDRQAIYGIKDVQEEIKDHVKEYISIEYILSDSYKYSTTLDNVENDFITTDVNKVEYLVTYISSVTNVETYLFAKTFVTGDTLIDRTLQEEFPTYECTNYVTEVVASSYKKEWNKRINKLNDKYETFGYLIKDRVSKPFENTPLWDANVAWALTKKDISINYEVKSWDNCAFLHYDVNKWLETEESEAISDDVKEETIECGNTVSLIYMFTVEKGTKYTGTASYRVGTEELSHSEINDILSGIYSTMCSSYEKTAESTSYCTYGLLI